MYFFIICVLLNFLGYFSNKFCVDFWNNFFLSFSVKKNGKYICNTDNIKTGSSKN